MAAYMIARVNVTDPEKYKNYIALSPAAVAEFGGKFIVRGGEMRTLEGPHDDRRVVVVEFPDLETVSKFYNSELYQKAKLERIGAAEAHFIAIDGL